jgi:hypothetical protein
MDVFSQRRGGIDPVTKDVRRAAVGEVGEVGAHGVGGA